MTIKPATVAREEVKEAIEQLKIEAARKAEQERRAAIIRIQKRREEVENQICNMIDNRIKMGYSDGIAAIEHREITYEDCTAIINDFQNNGYRAMAEPFENYTDESSCSGSYRIRHVGWKFTIDWSEEA